MDNKFEGSLAKNDEEILQLEVNISPENLLVGVTLNYLSILYTNMGEYEKALPLYQRALEIVEEKLGPKHPNTVTIKNNYNFLLLEMSKEDEEK